MTGVDPSSPWLGALSAALSLALVLALAWLMLRWLRRSPLRGAAADGPHVLRAVSLGTRERLVVVQHRDTEYLLGVTAASVSVIERRHIEAPRRTEPTL
jgi:flagellar protein FliO/FliZ